MTYRPRRSALYMPGSNARAIEKARTLGSDCVILDLEDSVAPEAKDGAREQIVAAIRAGGFGHREVLMRVNGPGAAWHEVDLAAAAASGANAVLVPKLERPEEIAAIEGVLARNGAPTKLRLWVMVETPLGILNAQSIAATAKGPTGARLEALVLGTNDIVKETRAEMTADRLPLLYALSHAILAARAYGLEILDSVYNDFRDKDGFRRECEQGRKLGFDGKTLIHPDQIAIANEVFAPPAAEVAWSRKILAAFELPENKGKAAINVDGRMVELLHAGIARRTVAVADAIAKAAQ